MSELINNSFFRKEKLKSLILKLHAGKDPAAVRAELISTLQQISYGEVVEVELELISEGLPETEVLAGIRKLSDNQILEIIAPFVPVPLLDKSLSLGYKHWVNKSSDGTSRVFFRL